MTRTNRRDAHLALSREEGGAEEEIPPRPNQNGHRLWQHGQNDGPCAIDGCERASESRGWCGLHYQRWRTHGDPLILGKRGPHLSPACTIEGCERPAFRGGPGYCLFHKRRQEASGDPLLDRPTRKPSGPPGPGLAHITSPTELGKALGVSKQRADQLLNREALRARQAVRAALATGALVKPATCARCDKRTADLEAHHWDYREPLDVRWLCTACHCIVHPHHPGSRRRLLEPAHA